MLLRELMSGFAVGIWRGYPLPSSPPSPRVTHWAKPKGRDSFVRGARAAPTQPRSSPLPLPPFQAPSRPRPRHSTAPRRGGGIDEGGLAPLHAASVYAIRSPPLHLALPLLPCLPAATVHPHPGSRPPPPRLPPPVLTPHAHKHVYTVRGRDPRSLRPTPPSYFPSPPFHPPSPPPQPSQARSPPSPPRLGLGVSLA